MTTRTLASLALLGACISGAAQAQQPAPAANAAPKPFAAGTPLSATNEKGVVMPMSKNVKVYGSFHFSESCTFDPDKNLIVAMNAANPRDAGSPPALTPNDGFVSLINPDGSVHTSKWIGATRDGLTLVHPLGSAVQGGTLYVNDGNMIRTFDLKNGTPKQAFEVKEALNLNGIGVASDGTMYASNTGNATDPTNKQRIYKVTASGQSSVFVEGPPLNLPNGVAIDPQGNVVVVNIGSNDVQTFDKAGKLIKTEHAAEAGNDGLVVLPDGTKYVSSVRFGSVSKIAPGKEAEVIATGIPSAASMCYDSKQNQLVIPMNPNNALAFIPLGRR
ncbi:MAG TPA: SMP-30/gluconolactonase/LRE family protein [Gammaproteobacteria bacterium]|nr:SMP-30/gluconolactonase/LRE family protein [Gammaproteobacteria bacterium]